jgi:hypothetical protein
MGGEWLGVKFIDAGGEVGFAGVVGVAKDLVEFRRIAADRRLLRGSVGDGDGHFGALWDIDRAGEADDAVFVEAVEGWHVCKPRVRDYLLFCVFKNLFRKLLACEYR